MNDSPNLPASLTVNPRLDRWIKFEDDRNVRIASGKVEIGQGIVRFRSSSKPNLD